MIIGQRYWIWIWYGILTLGLVGLIVSLYWARKTRWTNLDEILRAVGTIAVSLGMLLLLYRTGEAVAQVLLVLALIAFVWAFIVGRKRADPAGRGDRDEEDE